MSWVKINGYKELPIGNWLVKLDEYKHGCDLAVAVQRENSCIIGDYFAFDHAKVIAYHPLPKEDY